MAAYASVITVGLFGMAIAQTDSATISSPSPYVVTPSGEWDGADGPWASYTFTVGSDSNTTGQTLRGFPGFSFPDVLVPVDVNDCNNSTGTSCSQRVYVFGESPFWQKLGQTDVLSQLDLSVFSPDSSTDPYLGLLYGEDHFAFGASVDAGIVLKNQSLAATDSQELSWGLFGLSNSSSSFQGGENMSLLANFRRLSPELPSMSFSYTAGFYRNNTPPSLVIGGFDKTRFNASSTSLTYISASPTRKERWELRISIEAIDLILDNIIHAALLDGPISARIDPVTAQIWLPLSACDNFAHTFQLTWNDDTELYTVNTSSHNFLLQKNPSVSFRLGQGQYTLPYSAFNLTVTSPLVITESVYFPLKRAKSPDQYILGRTFLQATHISVDYDAGYFNLSEAIAGNSRPEIVPITRTTSLDPSPTATATGQPSAPPSKGLPAGTYVGIALGAVIVVLSLGLLLLSWKRKWWPFKEKLEGNTQDEEYNKAEMEGAGLPWVEAMGNEKVEMDASEPSHEVMGSHYKHQEIAGNGVYEIGEGVPSLKEKETE